jgi:hypothetical protein
MNNNNDTHTMTTIYTQNACGLWQRPQDTDGNILVDAPPDLAKLEYIIDHMHQHDVGAWLLQKTWEEGDNFDTEIGGYHVFRHNAKRGVTGRQHLYRGIAIILSPQCHEAWKLAGSPPLLLLILKKTLPVDYYVSLSDLTHLTKEVERLKGNHLQ